MTKHNEYIVRELLDTLYEAKGAILGLTALDTELEMQIKIRENECATTRRIDRAVSAIQQLEEPNPWHKVADGDLPEDGMHILFTTKTQYGNAYDVIYYPEPPLTDDMDYWMEIPEIKGGTEYERERTIQ